MPAWLINLKGNVTLILGAAIGFLVLWINILQKSALKKELKQQKAVSKSKDKANEALVKGVENEAKDNTLDYFDDKPE